MRGRLMKRKPGNFPNRNDKAGFVIFSQFTVHRTRYVSCICLQYVHTNRKEAESRDCQDQTLQSMSTTMIVPVIYVKGMGELTSVRPGDMYDVIFCVCTTHGKGTNW